MFLRDCAIAAPSTVDDDGACTRVVALGDRVGWLRISPDLARPALRVRVSLSLATHLMPIAPDVELEHSDIGDI